MSNVCDMANDCSNSADEAECGFCEFEDGACGWQNTGNTDYYWHRQDASMACDGIECQLGDHTFQDDPNNTTGHYMYLKHYLATSLLS